ncbi:MAG: DUF4115 domain-containing protein [Actinomycetota bacterium]|nr:DUF4115 domain-containing protein [Actinomycetota bacterium]
MGSILAETRTAAGRTIDQVSAATKIRSAIVRAIEADDFSACGGDFYARAHVKSIARYLGLDPAPLLERFDTQSGHADVPVAQMFDVDALAGRPERRGPNWSAAMATALAVVLLYGIVQVLAGPGTSRPLEPLGGPRPGAGAGTPASGRSPEPDTSAPPRDIVAKAPRARVTLELRVSPGRRSWVSVTGSGGRTLYQGVLASKARRTFTDRKVLKLVAGNAGALRLTVNGENLGAPGPVDQVARVSFDRRSPATG